MTVEVITRRQLAEEIKLVGEDGEISERAVAMLLRAPLQRWGLSQERAVLGYVRAQLTAAGFDGGPIVKRVLERLQGLRECERVSIGDERYVAPGEPRWVMTGKDEAVFLSVAAPPVSIICPEPRNLFDLAQRIHIESDNDLAELELAGAREISIGEWLTPLHFLRHATRRRRRPVRSDEIGLRGFWEILSAALREEGLPLTFDAEVRAVTGTPGSYFGRYDAPDAKGRWSAEPLDGVWCAYRRGYGEQHWHPIILEVDGQERRSLDLFDQDEWRWALLARGHALGKDELLVISDGLLRLTFPAPIQLRALLDLIGAWKDAWTWMWPSGAPDPLTLIS